MAFELQAFGIGVDGVDDAGAAGGRRADIEVMRGRHREGDEGAVEEDRHGEGDVRTVRGAAIGIVVQDDVARADRPRHARPRAFLMPRI